MFLLLFSRVEGRRRRTSRRRHARIRNRPPPVGGKDTNNALRCPGAWGAFFAATELLQAACQCHEQAASSCMHPQEQKNFVLTCAIDLPINLAGTYRDIRLGIAKHRLTIRAIIIVEINLAEPRRCICLGFSVTNSAQTWKDLLSGSMPMHSTTSNEKAELIKLLSKARKKLDESLLLITSILYLGRGLRGTLCLGGHCPRCRPAAGTTRSGGPGAPSSGGQWTVLSQKFNEETTGSYPFKVANRSRTMRPRFL